MRFGFSIHRSILRVAAALRTEIDVRIPDLRPLLAPIAPQGAMTFIDAPNTQAAAKLVVEDWADSCVTNLAGLKSYELRTIAELKKMNICWIPITKREAV